jgi:acyl-coenzyme A thioesterase PaaI-like protein
MTDLSDTRIASAISSLTRAMANAIVPSRLGGASLQLQDLRVTFAAPPPVEVTLGTADARVSRRTEQGAEVEVRLHNSLGELIASATGQLESLDRLAARSAAPEKQSFFTPIRTLARQRAFFGHPQ